MQIDIQPVDFSVSGTLEYNSVKYDYQHASSLNDLYQLLLNKFNQDHERHQLKMPPQSFFVARGTEKQISVTSWYDGWGCLDVCRKEIDHLWTVARYCDDNGKSDEQIAKVSHLFECIPITMDVFL